MHKYTSVFFFFLIAVATVRAEEATLIPTPQIDERIELLGIVFRLAGAEEYQCTSFKEYDDAINMHFADFKNHAVVQQAKILRRNGIGHDAVIAYGIHLSIEDGHVVLPDKNSNKTLDVLTARWSPVPPSLFIKALDHFYVKSRFHDFFTNHREMYRKTEERVQSITDKVDYAWFSRFFGQDNLEHFRLILCLTSEDSGYGGMCRFKDGHEEFYAILGASGPDVQYGERLIPFLVHEFNHSFCNRLIDKHLKELKPAADRLFPFVAQKMARQAYPWSSVMLYEYLVRACEIRYLHEHEKTREAERRTASCRHLGFLWIEELVEALDRYSKERDKYPTLESFMPEIVKLQNEIVTGEYIAKLKQAEESHPKVVLTIPANGSKNVDPSITEISVTFDRTMSGGMAWCTADGNASFPNRSKQEWPQWSEDRKTCTMSHVRLEPGKTYNIWLNLGEHDSFQSEDGIPLEPVHFTFTTIE